MSDQSHSSALQAGYELYWYSIESVLGQGAFGITYLAHDVNLDRQVAIKEYLPSQFAIRNSDLNILPNSDEHKEDFEWGLQRFISEAKILTKFEHPNLVRVFNVFEMNNTAYMVMNYEVGKSLQQILKSRKTLRESELMNILMPLLNGLEIMHEKGFVHRDIKPGNIYIRSDGSPVLLDFGSARQTRTERGQEMGTEQQNVTTLVSPGYAPIEQYSSSSSRQGPWTDIYGMGATLYKTVTGKMPLAAVDRSETIVHDMKDCYINLSDSAKGKYSEKFLTAIDHAMAFKADERPQNVAAWRQEFDIVEDDNPATLEPDSQYTSDDVKTFRPDMAGEAITVKIDTGEEETEKVDSTAVIGVSKPIYLQAKWLVSAVVVIVMIAIWFVNYSGDNEFISEDKDMVAPIVQTPLDSDQSFVEETLPLASEEQTQEETILLSSEDQARVEELLTLAEEDISALRLTSPNNNNALNKYLSILMIDENNIEANEGIQSISDKYIALAYGAMQSGDLAKAEAHIEKAESIYSESVKIAPARNALQEKYKEQETGRSKQQTSNTDEDSGGFWDSIKKWDEESQETKKEESAIDSNIRKHFE